MGKADLFLYLIVQKYYLSKLMFYVFSGATLRVDAGGSLYSPQLWQIDDHQKIPEYNWDPYQVPGEDGAKSKL